jgi:predicted GNAT superfamily acetyltransferase
MVGYVLSIPGYRNRHSYLHSHMLAVRAAYRNRRIGQRLKLAQRDDALKKGIELMEWTFDPLEIKNAFMNIERLGAIARRYVVDLYGATSSELQTGMPSDRLYAEWWLNSRRVTSLLEGGTLPRIPPVNKVEVPAQIYEWRSSTLDRQKALDVQRRNREALRLAFADGLSVVGFARDAAGNGTYELAAWDEPWKY